mmetsp:Transcript_27006/g.58996  ORF Transcript_27006/g.58996 Transcript_27006/m.58996 type:complete len:84 (+) Transcript_27006:1005-1256(+)
MGGECARGWAAKARDSAHGAQAGVVGRKSPTTRVAPQLLEMAATSAELEAPFEGGLRCGAQGIVRAADCPEILLDLMGTPFES